MNKAEREFFEECASRQGKTPEQATEDERKFWSNEDG